MLAYPVVAHNPATDAVADQDHAPAHRFPKDQVVKSRDAVQLVRRHPQELGQVADAFIRDPAPMALNDLQRINTRGSPDRVLIKLRLDLSSFFFGQHKYAMDRGTGKNETEK